MTANKERTNKLSGIFNKDTLKKVFSKDTIKWMKENKEQSMLIGFALFTVILICINTFALQIPVVAVCSIIILELVLLNLLDGIPVWVHAVVVLAQVALGFYVGKGVFMILNALVYVVGLLIFVFSKND